MSMDLEEQYDRIYRYCYFKVRRQEVAEDITQETFLRFYERFGHYGNEWTLQYLYRVAHNLCIDEYRRPVMEQLSEEIPGEGYEKEVTTKISIQAALEVLSEEEKEILLLRYVNEVSVAVICKLLQISRFALYRKMKKALKKLQYELREEEFV